LIRSWSPATVGVKCSRASVPAAMDMALRKPWISVTRLMEIFFIRRISSGTLAMSEARAVTFSCRSPAGTE